VIVSSGESPPAGRRQTLGRTIWGQPPDVDHGCRGPPDEDRLRPRSPTRRRGTRRVGDSCRKRVSWRWPGPDDLGSGATRRVGWGVTRHAGVCLRADLE
jgi:hypothetical protein